jgi:hypothetical protein
MNVAAVRRMATQILADSGVQVEPETQAAAAELSPNSSRP